MSLSRWFGISLASLRVYGATRTKRAKVSRGCTDITCISTLGPLEHEHSGIIKAFSISSKFYKNCGKSWIYVMIQCHPDRNHASSELASARDPYASGMLHDLFPYMNEPS